jgi:hypothetical protein
VSRQPRRAPSRPCVRPLAADPGSMTPAAEITRRLDHDGYVVLPQCIGGEELAAAREEIAVLLASADWGSGFDGSRTRRVWALLARTRCMDRAALDPVVLDEVEQMIRPGAQFSLTYATQVHPGQDAQMLHYEQGIYPLPRDRDVMVTAIWALDDFTAGNGATRVIPGSHRRAEAQPETSEAMSVEMPAGSVLLFTGRLWHGAGANTSTSPRLGVVIDYVQPWLRPCEAHTLSADPGQARQLPQRLQELLGFNQPSPHLGFINGRHPREWLLDNHHHDSGTTRRCRDSARPGRAARVGP